MNYTKCSNSQDLPGLAGVDSPGLDEEVTTKVGESVGTGEVDTEKTFLDGMGDGGAVGKDTVLSEGKRVGIEF